ncbi:polynucleotidyl transferase [Striga asiatica]|uniref:Polynucleotidyl transferase n=1 Tax=Striga asiatica TaxID=4170 RepID=A0A5A7PER6_STRAF|nr:polynucleotidyl transferase [Striga asiatica]
MGYMQWLYSDLLVGRLVTGYWETIVSIGRLRRMGNLLLVPLTGLLFRQKRSTTGAYGESFGDGPVRKGSVTSYGWCPSKEESVLHVLRDCSEASEVWIRLVPSHVQHSFFTLDLKEWLTSNLLNSSGPSIDVDNWECFFGVTLLASAKCTGASRVSRLIRWEAPPTSWVKVNSDGAHNKSSDTHGRWLGGFTMTIGLLEQMGVTSWSSYDLGYGISSSCSGSEFCSRLFGVLGSLKFSRSSSSFSSRSPVSFHDFFRYHDYRRSAKMTFFDTMIMAIGMTFFDTAIGASSFADDDDPTELAAYSLESLVPVGQARREVRL